tara:strand:- start:651 stop:875 length:225 start_codon:yes stop_codon:yes gene_type:complete
MHIPNNPQLDSFHHSLNEDKRRLQKEKLRAYHSNLNRTEKEIMDDYNRRVEKMKEVSTVPTDIKSIRRTIDIFA